MKQSVIRSVLAVAMLCGVVVGHAYASVLTFTDLGGGQYGVTLQPLTFTLGANQPSANRVVIEDFFTTNATGLGNDISGDIIWSRNGGPSFTFSFETNNGNFPGTAGQIDANDLLFNFTFAYGAAGIGPLSAGDTITVSTSNMVFSTTGPRIPQAGPFTAHLLSATTSISTASGVTLAPAAVPEPTSLILLGSGLALGARRWRKRRKS